MNTYRNLEVGEIIERGDEIAEQFHDRIEWNSVWWRRIGEPRTKDILIRRLVDSPFVFSDKSLGQKKIAGIKKSIPLKNITLSSLTLDLLERRDCIRTNTTAVPPHKFPLRKIGRLWPEQFRPTRDFQELEDQYHGFQKPLELVTGGNLAHSLDALIKSLL